jgi:hypothetical protein
MGRTAWGGNRTSGTETYYVEAKEAGPGSIYVKTRVRKALLRYRRDRTSAGTS